MVVGVGVGVGVGEEGGVDEEMEALPPHALIMIETRKRAAERTIGRHLERFEELIGAACSPSGSGI